jgi:hypothetical protein
MTIWKYSWPQYDLSDKIFEIPSISRILHVDSQYNCPCMWMLVDPTREKITRKFTIVGTGFSVPPEATKYIGTTLLHNDGFVAHIFEIILSE